MEQIIGEGSYGVVAQKKNSATVHKYSHWLSEFSKDDGYIVCSVLREVCFYQYIRRALSNSHYSYLAAPPHSINKALSVTRNQTAVAVSQKHGGKRLTVLGEGDRTVENFLKIFLQILQAVAWLKSFGCSHGDIKADNILVDLNWKASLIDFGSACFFHHKNLSHDANRCTITTVAPEELLHRKWTVAADVWSCGVVMFEFLSRKAFILELAETMHGEKYRAELHRLIYKNGDTKSIGEAEDLLKDLYANTSEGHIYATICRYISDKNISELIQSALTVDPHMRPDAEDLLSMEAFAPHEPKRYLLFNWQQFKTQACDYDYVDLKKVPSINRQLALQFMALLVNMPKSPFRKSWFGHAALMFDRWMFRASQKTTLPNNLSLHAAIALAISGAVLSHSFVQVSDIATHSKSSHEEVETTMGDFLDVLHWQVWNMSPDLLVLQETSRQPPVKIQLALYMKVALLSESVASVAEILKEMMQHSQ